MHISAANLALAETHAHSVLPSECCGVLLGHSHENHLEVLTLKPCNNADLANPARRYRIAPAELIHAEKEARRCGLEIVGFYHSHPNGGAQWSQTDLEEAHWLGCAYLIIGLCSDDSPYNCFLLCGNNESDKFFQQIQLRLTESGSNMQA